MELNDDLLGITGLYATLSVSIDLLTFTQGLTGQLYAVNGGWWSAKCIGEFRGVVLPRSEVSAYSLYYQVRTKNYFGTLATGNWSDGLAATDVNVIYVTVLTNILGDRIPGAGNPTRRYSIIVAKTNDRLLRYAILDYSEPLGLYLSKWNIVPNTYRIIGVLYRVLHNRDPDFIFLSERGEVSWVTRLGDPPNPTNIIDAIDIGTRENRAVYLTRDRSVLSDGKLYHNQYDLRQIYQTPSRLYFDRATTEYGDTSIITDTMGHTLSSPKVPFPIKSGYIFEDALGVHFVFLTTSGIVKVLEIDGMEDRLLAETFDGYLLTNLIMVSRFELFVVI